MFDRVAHVPDEPDPWEPPDPNNPADWEACDEHETTYPAGGKCRRCEWEKGMEEFYSDRGPKEKGD